MISRAALRAAAIASAMAAGLAGANQDFIGIPLSARQSGMSDVSVMAEDVLAGWSNPAALGALRHAEVELGGGQRFSGDVSTMDAGFAIPARKWRFGGYFSRMSLSYPETDSFGSETGKVIEHTGEAGGATVAFQIRALTLGVGAKVANETLFGRISTDFGIDAGARYSYKSICGILSMVNQFSEGLPSEVRAGVSYAHAPWHAVFGTELRYSTLSTRIGTAAEWRPIDWCRLRAGVGGIGNAIRPAAGLTLRYRGAFFDCAFSAPASGITDQANLGYSFGGI